MEIDVGDDKGCAYQTVRDVGGYRDVSVRVPGGDVGRAVELTGTKNLVGMERKRKALEGKEAREKIRIGFDVRI